MELREIKLLHTMEEVVEASNRAYKHYISVPGHDSAVVNHRKWWPYATVIGNDNGQ